MTKIGVAYTVISSF